MLFDMVKYGTLLTRNSSTVKVDVRQKTRIDVTQIIPLDKVKGRNKVSTLRWRTCLVMM